MNNLTVDCLIAFFGGAIYEAGCVGWVHYAEKRKPLRACLFSMLCATSQVAGISESIRTLIAALCFIVGYGFGTYAAVEFKRRCASIG
jgi:hypothetical protein